LLGVARAPANCLRGHRGVRRVMPMSPHDLPSCPRSMPTRSWVVGDRAPRTSLACQRTVRGPRYRRNPPGAPRRHVLRIFRSSTPTTGWGTAIGTIRSWLASRTTLRTVHDVARNGAVARSSRWPPRRDASQLAAPVDLYRSRLGRKETQLRYRHDLLAAPAGVAGSRGVGAAARDTAHRAWGRGG
jgi:hypothetical protein